MDKFCTGHNARGYSIRARVLGLGSLRNGATFVAESELAALATEQLAGGMGCWRGAAEIVFLNMSSLPSCLWY
jgi:hypothetical protein